MIHNTDHSELIPETPRVSKHSSSSLPWEPAKPQDKACFWERIEAPLPPLRSRPKCDFIHARQLSPFLERSGTAAVFKWGYLVRLRRIRLLRNWSFFFMGETERPRNPGPAYGGYWEGYSRVTLLLLTWTVPVNALRPVRLCKGDSASTNPSEKGRCFRTTNCRKVSSFTSQQASEYVDHDLLTNRIHVTHYAGCSILFNKDTFYPNVDVKSIYLHDTRRDLPDQVMEGTGMGFTRCSFTCNISASASERAEVFHRVVSTYQQHFCPKKGTSMTTCMIAWLRKMRTPQNTATDCHAQFA